jgi:hypothetical protein
MERPAQAFVEQQLQLEKQKMAQDFESELQARVNAMSLNTNSGHVPLVDMMDESNKENFMHANQQYVPLRNLKGNTANLIRNRSSLSSDEE